MIANRETLMFRAPFIELNPLKGAFTVSHVPYEELEVIAPTLEYTIYQASPVALRVKYKPTGKHLVQLNMVGAGGGAVRSLASRCPTRTSNLLCLRDAWATA
eukprot:386713_1